MTSIATDLHSTDIEVLFDFLRARAAVQIRRAESGIPDPELRKTSFVTGFILILGSCH